MAIQKLKQINNAFYRENHASFSQTRNHAWDGWERVLASAQNAPKSVLDVACGNMRFKAFLNDALESPFAYYGVDSCSALVPDAMRDSFQELDLIDELANETLVQHIEAPSCDLTTCFGFMHHVPSFELRAALMRFLVGKIVEGGTIAVSFWQFALDDAMREKAQKVTHKALQSIDVELEEGDYLLGWQNRTGTYRYCHSFTDGEVAQLVEMFGDNLSFVDRFKADGKSGVMNAYVVLRKF